MSHTPDAKVDLRLASVKESLEDAFYDTLNCAFDSDFLARAAITALEQSDAVMGEARAYERAAKVADYAVERAERDWRDPAKREAVYQVAGEIAEVIREYARSATPIAPVQDDGSKR